MANLLSGSPSTILSYSHRFTPNKRSLDKVFEAVFVAMLLSCAVIPSYGWAAKKPEFSRASARIDEGRLQGVVAERVDKFSESELAGLHPGDTVLNWQRGVNGGQMDSPFDLWRLENEEAPLGEVTLEGLRGETAMTWRLGQGDWGIRSRINLDVPLLSRYLDGLKLEESGKKQEAAEVWQKAIAETRSQGLTACWMWFRIAEELSAAKLFKEADDAYRQSVTIASSLSVNATVQIKHRFAASYVSRLELDNAANELQGSLTMLEKSGGHRLLTAKTYLELSDVERRRGNVLTPKQYTDHALEIQEHDAPDSRVLAWTLSAALQSEIGLGDYEVAERHAFRAMEIEKKLPH